MKPVFLLAILVVGGLVAGIWLSKRTPSGAALTSDVGLKDWAAMPDGGDAGQIQILEGQVEYLEGQVRVLMDENAALMERLGRLGMKAGPAAEMAGPGGIEPDFVGMGLELVKLRELEALPMAPMAVPAEKLEEKIVSWLRERQPEDRGERLGRALHAMGWTEEAVDPLPLRAALLARQLGAWYSAADGTLYVDEALAAEGQGNDAHREAMGLAFAMLLREHGSTLFPAGKSGPLSFDEQLAREAVLAGDAGLTRFLYTLQHPEIQNPDELPQEDPDHAFNQVPLPQFMRQMHFFAFTEGFEFMQGLHAAGGYAQMSASYGRPPKNTAEVMNGERYLTGPFSMVEQLSMKVAPINGAPPFWDDTMGQYAILAALQAWNEPERAGLGAQGWVADRLLTYAAVDPKERGHAVWQTLWLDADWAEAFFRAMAECQRQFYEVALPEKERELISFEMEGRHVTLLRNRGGMGVLLVDAADAATAKALLEQYRGE